MNTIFYRFVLLGLVISLSSCFGPAPTPEPLPTLTPTPRPAPVTITWGFWGDPWEVKINKRVIDLFEADHPHITVETFHRPWSDYDQELTTMFANGEPVPDVLFWGQITEDALNGYFLDLRPMIEAENYDLDDFFPALIAQNTINNQLYALPRDSDTKVIYYNKRLFNQANIAYPESDWSWDDLRQTSLALKEAGVTDYSFAFEINWWWLIWMWQNGVEPFDHHLFPTETQLGDPAAAEAVQFFADLINVDQVTPPPELLLSSNDIGQLFKEGRVAMAFGNHAFVPAFAEVDDLEWDVVGLPYREQPANYAAGAGYAISANTPHQEAAWTFLNFLVGFKGQAVFAESGIAVPARRSVAQDEVFISQKQVHKATVFIEQTEVGKTEYIFVGSREMRQLVNEALTPVWHGEQDAASALQTILPKIQEILANINPHR